MIPLLSVPCPRASTVPLLEAAIAARKLTPSGGATMVHFEPFQCSRNVPRSWCPVAQTSLAETPATAPRPLLPCGFGLGLGTTVQAVPSKCRLTFWLVVGLVATKPMAHTSLAESAEIAPLLMLTLAKAGLETMLQLVPSQCSTSA